MRKFILADKLSPSEILEARAFRVVINDELNDEQIESVVGAIGYAQKATLKSDDMIILNQAQVETQTILDIDFAFDSYRTSSFRINVYEFFERIKQYVDEGVMHKRANRHLGGVGADAWIYIAANPIPRVSFTVNIVGEGADFKQRFQRMLDTMTGLKDYDFEGDF